MKKTSKIVRSLVAAAAAAVLVPAAWAQTLAGATVDVSVALTPQCRWSGGTTPTGTTVSFGDYTAFQAGANPGVPSGPLTVQCTRAFGASPTITWDGGTANGVVAGLLYTLTVDQAETQAGAAPVAASNTPGTPRVFSFTLGGTMAGGQPGGSGAASVQRTLTLAF